MMLLLLGMTTGIVIVVAIGRLFLAKGTGPRLDAGSVAIGGLRTSSAHRGGSRSPDLMIGFPRPKNIPPEKDSLRP